MSAESTYTFGNYTLRPCSTEDMGMAQAWTSADESHAGIISPSFWLEQSKGVDSYLLSDERGPLLFFRMERVVRVLVQFCPQGETEIRDRTREALAAGLRWLNVALDAVAVGEIIFDSANQLLRLFVAGKLGFRPRPTTLSRRVFVVPKPPAVPFFPDETGESITSSHAIELPLELQARR